jgi:hypothetical protein
MRTSIGRIAAAALAGASALAIVPGVANASDVNPNSASALCGSGYKVVDHHATEGAFYTYLLYNSSNGKNCAVTLKQKSLTTKNTTDVYLISANGKTAEDFGSYTSYAGPIYLSAPGECVKYGGSVMYGNTIYTYDSNWEACG